MALIARKRFGQNFLQDEGVIQRIIDAVHPEKGQHLVEIGPGRGAITRDLLLLAGRLDVIELDRDLVPLLEKQCAGLGELTIHQADALKFDFSSLIHNGVNNGERLRIVGNLPYNISTPLLFHLISQANYIHDMYFMLQKEVTERLCAQPGSKDYGRLSVMVQYRCRVCSLFTVASDAFIPAPRVESAVIRIEPYCILPVNVLDEEIFQGLVKKAFAHRRKTLANNLKGVLSVLEIEQSDIDPGLRAETLSIEEFARLSDMVAKKQG